MYSLIFGYETGTRKKKGLFWLLSIPKEAFETLDNVSKCTLSGKKPRMGDVFHAELFCL